MLLPTSRLAVVAVENKLGWTLVTEDELAIADERRSATAPGARIVADIRARRDRSSTVPAVADMCPLEERNSDAILRRVPTARTVIMRCPSGSRTSALRRFCERRAMESRCRSAHSTSPAPRCT